MKSDDATPPETRAYHSPLRKAQFERTRELIIESLTDLLAERPSDEISTRDVARVAGVSERTVYRHFADRRALHEALSDRWMEDDDGPSIDDAEHLDDLVEMTLDAYRGFERRPRETIASVLLNADPRRVASDTAHRSDQWIELTDVSFPDLDEQQRIGLAAVTRILGSAQVWLRLREEFGLGGEATGHLASWAIGALLAEARGGNPPPGA